MWARIVAFVLIAAALLGVLLYSQHRLRVAPQKVSGFIEAHDVRVGSRVGGRIARVLVEEGQLVKAGMPLLELEPFDLKERLAEAQKVLAQRQAQHDLLKNGFRKEEIAQARAKRDQLKAELEKLQAGPRPQEINEAQAFLDHAQSELLLAQQNFDRVTRTFNAGSASRDEVDQATTQLKSAQAELIIRQQRIAILKEGSRKEDIASAAAQVAQADQALLLMENGPRSEDIAAAQAAVDAQKAAIAVLEKQIGELTITAPSDGIIEAVDIRPGDLLAASAPALTLVETRELWVRAYVPENRQYPDRPESARHGGQLSA